MDCKVIGLADIPADKISQSKGKSEPLPQNMSFGTLRTYISSENAKRGFCKSCGATIFVQKEPGNVIKVAVGLFAAPEGALAKSWLDWIDFAV